MVESIEHEWRKFELYEKIRLRERRKKLFVLTLALLIFLGLCSVPVIKERSPKWLSLRAAQRISIELEKLKTLAIQEKRPARITFTDSHQYQIDILDSCANGNVVRSEARTWQNEEGQLKVLTQGEASSFQVNLGVNQICFDPVFGLNLSEENPSPENAQRVLIIAPVNDLSERRLDRASYVILQSDSARISIN